MDNCIFCKIVNNEIESTTIFENDDFKAIFDAFPSSKGHALIISKKHYENIYDMEESLIKAMFFAATQLAKKLKTALSCDGVNILQNNEKAAGQTVFHTHIHIIPRYTNDNINISWKSAPADLEALKKILSLI